MDEFIGVGEAAKRLGLHVNTVRNMARDGRLPVASIPGSNRIKFRAEDIDAFAAARGEEITPNVRVRDVEPERVTANDLNAWGGRVAQEKAPEMLRRLLDATPGITQLSVRAGDGVALRGWDGLAMSDGMHASYLPAGRLRFELGTDQNAASKAESDYNNRLALPKDERIVTNFVFVTTRRWSGKTAWAEGKSAEGEFSSVSALDADDLEGWLQKTPSAHIWLSELLGRYPRDVQTIERWWDEFRLSMRVELPEQLFATSQEFVREGIAALLGSTDSRRMLTVQGRSIEEALAVTYVALHALDDRPSAILVKSAAAWARLSESNVPHLLIPTFPEPSLALAANGRHPVILLAHKGMAVKPGTDLVEVAVPGRSETSRVLQESGIASREAERMAALYRRSPKAFFRSLALDSRAQSAVPDSHRDDLAAASRLALAVQWTADDGDHALLERLVRANWVELESVIVSLSSGDDPVFVRAGDAWRVAAPVEASLSLFPALTSSDLERWAEVVEGALFEHNPLDIPDAAARFAAQLRGEKRPHSREIEEGLVGGVALMALVGGEVAGRAGVDWAERVVGRILSRASGLGTEGWKRIAHVLPPLAEAAPELFLDTLLDDLGDEAPSLKSLFPPADEQTDVLSQTSPHVYLLWALEVLGRSREHFPSAMNVLARLTDYDHGRENSANTAFQSLENLLLPWIQYTAAGMSSKMSVLRRLVDRRPDLGWRLLLQLLPNSNSFSMTPSSPTYRDWGPETQDVSVAEWGAFVGEVTQMIVDLAGTDVDRWVDVVPLLDDLHPRDYDIATDAMLAAAAATDMSTLSARRLWDALNAEILRHEEFADAHWALSNEKLDKLRRVLAALPDPGKASEYAALFGWDRGRLGLNGDDSAAPVDVPTMQRAAVAEIVQVGRDELERLIHKVGNPHIIGALLVELSTAEIDGWALDWLLGERQAQRQAAQSYFARRSLTEGGLAWIEARLCELHEAPTDRLALALTMEANPATWDLLERIEKSLVDAYWCNVSPWVIGEGERSRAFKELLDRHRPVSALQLFDFALIHEEKGGPVVMGPDDATAALDEILSGNSAEEMRGASHRIGTALDYLANKGASDGVMARYEFLFSPLLDRTTHYPAALYRVLRSNPAEFVELVCLATRPASKPKDDSRDPAASALAWRVLRDWKQLPGTDGTTWIADAEELTQWVIECRSLLAERDRAKVGDEMLGAVLAYGASEAAEGWPAVAVCEVLEIVGTHEMENGFVGGVMDARGSWTKGIYEGGDQERELAHRFRARADEREDWRRVHRALKAVARGYERQAQRADAEAKWDADGA